MAFFNFFSSSSAVKRISPADAKKMIEAGECCVVDVRRPEEYQQGHIDGALLIPNETIAGQDPAELTDKDKPIVVYCRSGARSSAACNKLDKMGYTKVYDLGGIMTWPYEVVKG